MRRKRWSPDIKGPWLTRAEAADYLRCSTRSLDRKCIRMIDERIPGKIRRVSTPNGVGQFGHTNGEVRVLAEDVYALCPLPA